MRAVFTLAHLVILEMVRRKDIYVLFVLTALLTLIAAAANIFDDTRVVRYLKEISLTLIWVSGFVLAVTSAARQIPAEREARTLFTMLAKPVSRWQFIAGKFLGCWLACATLLTLVYFTIPHLELFDIRDLIIHRWPPVPWVFWLGALLYAAAYAGMILTGAWLMFRRRPLN